MGAQSCLCRPWRSTRQSFPDAVVRRLNWKQRVGPCCPRSPGSPRTRRHHAAHPAAIRAAVTPGFRSSRANQPPTNQQKHPRFGGLSSSRLGDEGFDVTHMFPEISGVTNCRAATDAAVMHGRARSGADAVVDQQLDRLISLCSGLTAEDQQQVLSLAEYLNRRRFAVQ
jgi:hypothetical protein